MKWCSLFIAALLIGCCASESNAQQRYFSITQRSSSSRPHVSYYVDVTPQPVRTRSLSGNNVPPHNPVFDGGGRALSRQPTGRTSTGARGFRCGAAGSTTPTYTTPVYVPSGKPTLIINPFVDQTGYEHLGKEAVR